MVISIGIHQEMLIKATMRSYLALVKIAIIKENTNNKCWQGCPGVRSSLVFSGFGLKPPASGFQSYSYSSLKTSPSIHQALMIKHLG